MESNVRVGSMVKVHVPSLKSQTTPFLAIVVEMRATHSVKVVYLKATGQSVTKFVVPDVGEQEVDYFSLNELILLDSIPHLSNRDIYTFSRNPLA
jgi:hypothetical protein